MKETERKIFDPKAMGWKFVIQDSECGNIITGFDTREEAEAELQRYESKDKENGTYVEGFYEVAVRNSNGDYERAL